MNTQENAVASELLEQIKVAARVTPDKALLLAQAYRELCSSAATRTQAERKDQ